MVLGGLTTSEAQKSTMPFAKPMLLRLQSTPKQLKIKDAASEKSCFIVLTDPTTKYARQTRKPLLVVLHQGPPLCSIFQDSLKSKISVTILEVPKHLPTSHYKT